MNQKIEQVADQLRYQISQGVQIPSRLDLTSVPELQEQDYRNALTKVFKESNVPCPEINFISVEDKNRMNKKIDDLIAEIVNETKNGKKVHIRLDFEGFEELVISLPPILINRMRSELGYAFIDGSSEKIYDDHGLQIAIVMKFEPV